MLSLLHAPHRPRDPLETQLPHWARGCLSLREASATSLEPLTLSSQSAQAWLCSGMEWESLSQASPYLLGSSVRFHLLLD